jgi:hypothetical protein
MRDYCDGGTFNNEGCNMFPSALLGLEYKKLYGEQIRSLALAGKSSREIIEGLELDKNNSIYADSTLKRAVGYVASGFDSKLQNVPSYRGVLSDLEREKWRKNVLSHSNPHAKKLASKLGVIARGRCPWTDVDKKWVYDTSKLPAFVGNLDFLTYMVSNRQGVDRTKRSVGNIISKYKKSLDEQLYNKTAKESAEVFMQHMLAN